MSDFRKNFDDALDNATHAALSAYGMEADKINRFHPATLEQLNDGIEEVMRDLIDEDHVFPAKTPGFDMAATPQDAKGVDDAADEATHRALACFGLTAEEVDADALNDAITEVMAGIVDFRDDTPGL
ncbi:hypothetical protein [Defluviimonas salinarum]|uniref:Uncharacterized protein n=1 Tax=Defluviimonas salinarum TaxID=2992147 RepID=A0ABT3J5K4_9RHOB|nr:hypothetical protein [Defluviimonas salinarum]MCW3782971.1 hypothetical protein [Defluviimonas salinarum]